MIRFGKLWISSWYLTLCQRLQGFLEKYKTVSYNQGTSDFIGVYEMCMIKCQNIWQTYEILIPYEVGVGRDWNDSDSWSWFHWILTYKDKKHLKAIWYLIMVWLFNTIRLRDIIKTQMNFINFNISYQSIYSTAVHKKNHFCYSFPWALLDLLMSNEITKDSIVI